MQHDGTVIHYIKLKNFAAIYAGMKKREIEIDLSGNNNRIILLIGPNGSGKTAILSNLHPFAYPGSLDIRNSDGLIMQGQSGYKEIHIELNDELYVIKHFYSPTKEGHSVKSYVSKSGQELNPNGNVSSFKEMILLCMGLESDYLKLLRLGSNVTNFIDMKSSDRKNFTSELLSDVDVYSQCFKKVNEDIRYLKSLLRIVVDKMDKLNLYSVEEANDVVNRLKILLNKEKSKCSSDESLLWTYRSEVTGLMGDINEFDETFINSTNGLQDIEFDLYGMINKSKAYRGRHSKKDIQDELMEISLKLNDINNTNQFLTSQLDKLLTQRDNKDISLKSINSGLDYSNMQDLYLQLHRRKAELDKIYANFTPTCTKEDILTALRLFQHLDVIVGNILEFNTDRITKVLSLKKSSLSVSDEVKTELRNMDNQIQKLELLRKKRELDYEDGVIYYAPAGCKPKGCPYYNSYKKTFREEANTGDIDKKILSIENVKDEIRTMIDIEHMLDGIDSILDLNSPLLSSLPKGTFNRNYVIGCITTGRSVYDESKFSKYIQALEEFEEYKTIQSKIKELKTEITHMEKHKSTIDIIQNELYEIDKEIAQTTSDIDRIKDIIPTVSEHKDRLLDELTELDKFIEISESIVKLTEERESLNRVITDMVITKDKCQYYLSSMPQLEKAIAVSSKTIAEIEENITLARFKALEYENLLNERTLLEEKFDEMEILRETLSSTKGLPLLFMKLYMEDIKVRVNDLLAVVYDGDLEIDDFKIDDKEFNIPYTKRGMTVSDIRICSQGERSFISVALSFALMKQSVDKYNVLLLDEIDATLDMRNRRLFIDILERQLDMINARQCFMITHNDMFDNHPVSIIYTNKKEEGSNIIQIR